MPATMLGVSESAFSIARNGDYWEKVHWQAFASERFPSYEDFWLAHVVPLTNRGMTTERLSREHRIRFRTDAELAADGLGHEDVAVAQLHYTLLLHVGRVWQLLDQGLAFATSDAQRGRGFDSNDFFESFTRLSGASDVADEVLERRRTRGSGTYPAWDERAGGRARKAWRKREGDPLTDVRSYRNRLVHGRVVPQWGVRVFEQGTGAFHGERVMYPRIDRVQDHLDWRRAYDPANIDAVLSEFENADAIVREAWERVLDYAEASWRRHVL
jgi:hypothetical protein